jgi:hypothetical protein
MASSDAEVIYCQPDPEYRRACGESQSHLKSILVSPAHYVAQKKRKFFTSAAMTIGTATHCKLLEGEETFASSFVKKPEEIKMTTKEGKEWKAAQTGKTVLLNDSKDGQWDCVVGMTEALRKLDWFNPAQPDYRKYNEVSIYWNENNIPCKARLDRVIVTEDEVLVLDLKTTDSIAFEKFQSKLVDLGYDFQAGWYSHAAELVYKKPVRFIFIAVERGEPHMVDLFEAPPHMIEEARYKNKKALEILKSCRDTNQWPTRQPSLKMLDYPRWYNYASTEGLLMPSPEPQDDFIPLF